MSLDISVSGTAETKQGGGVKILIRGPIIENSQMEKPKD